MYYYQCKLLLFLFLLDLRTIDIDYEYRDVFLNVLSK